MRFADQDKLETLITEGQEILGKKLQDEIDGVNSGGEHLRALLESEVKGLQNSIEEGTGKVYATIEEEAAARAKMTLELNNKLESGLQGVDENIQVIANLFFI